MKHKDKGNKILLKAKKGDSIMVVSAAGLVQLPTVADGASGLMLRMAAFLLTDDSEEMNKIRNEVLRLYALKFSPPTEAEDAVHPVEEA